MCTIYVISLYHEDTTLGLELNDTVRAILESHPPRKIDRRRCIARSTWGDKQFVLWLNTGALSLLYAT